MHDDRLRQRDRMPSKDQWIYDILEGRREQDKILFKDNVFCLICNTSPYKKTEPHIPYDRRLRSLRSLRPSDIPLLEHIKKQTHQVLGITRLLTEVHYPPSTYHFHMHIYSKRKAFLTNAKRR